MEALAIRPDHVHMAHKPAAHWRKTFLREWREHAGYTLENAAAELGLTHPQLSKIERGHHPYSQKLLEPAARLYGCSVLDLLTRLPTKTESVFTIYESLDERQQRRAERLLRAIRDDQD